MEIQAFMYDGKEIAKERFMFLFFGLMGSDGFSVEKIKSCLDSMKETGKEVECKGHIFAIDRLEEKEL